MNAAAGHVTPRRLRGPLLDALVGRDEATAGRLLTGLDAGDRYDLAVAAQRLAELADPAVAAAHTYRFAPSSKRHRWTPRRAATAVTLVGAGASWLAVLGYFPSLATAVLFTLAPFLLPKLRQLWAAHRGHATGGQHRAGARTPRPAR